MSVRLLLTTTVVAAGVLAPAATAGAAKKAPKYPTVSKISPMRVEIGGTMTITGKNFVKGRAKNTVVFRRSGKKVVFAKADGLTTRKLRLKVPSKLRTSLGKTQGAFVATKFQVRVLARRFGKTYTALKKSPVIVPDSVEPAPATPAEAKKAAEAAAAAAAAATAAATTPAPPSDCDRDGTADSADADDDNDLLNDPVETSIGTQTCVADTDGDGMTDGWEYQSALDLNQRSCPGIGDYPTPCAAVLPYPGKRPYPNPRDGADGGTDYDGDWLTSSMEHAAWSRKAATSAPHRTLTNMWYSDGKQASQDTSSAAGCRGMVVPEPFNGDETLPEFRQANGTPYPADLSAPEYEVYSLDNWGRDAGNGCLNDAERDEDGDYLTNVDESAGPLSGSSWWNGVFTEPTYRVQFAPTDWLDGDSDGDGTVDGLDDQDHDDFLNVEELDRGTPSIAKNGADTMVRSGLWVDAFNPCLPAVYSRTCPRSIPLSGEVWRPFHREDEYTNIPRWPLYGARSQYLPLGPAGDAWYNTTVAPVDPDGTGPQVPSTNKDATPPEWWLGGGHVALDPALEWNPSEPGGLDWTWAETRALVPLTEQSALPPQHPLPR
jgi:hypothetical protein